MIRTLVSAALAFSVASPAISQDAEEVVQRHISNMVEELRDKGLADVADGILILNGTKEPIEFSPYAFGYDGMRNQDDEVNVDGEESISGGAASQLFLANRSTNIKSGKAPLPCPLNSPIQPQPPYYVRTCSYTTGGIYVANQNDYLYNNVLLFSIWYEYQL